VALAAEHEGAYDAGDPAGPESTRGGGTADHDPATGHDTDGPAASMKQARDTHGEAGTPAPFGSPVLAELPDLAAALVDLAEADRLQVSAVVALARHIDPDEVAHASGVGVEHWLAITARATRLDRRFLLRLARLLVRLPGLCDAAAEGLVSFAQLRALRLALTGLPPELDATVDDWLADAARRLAAIDADPQALVEQARHAVAELTSAVDDDQEDASTSRRLILQPRLDGAGGRFYGEEDAWGFAMLDAATAPRGAQLDDPDRARADNLQAWLHHACDPDTGPASDSPGQTPADGTCECNGEHDAPASSTSELADLNPADHAPVPDLDSADLDHAPDVDVDGLAASGEDDRPDTPEEVDSLAGLPGSIRARIEAGKQLRQPTMLTRIDLDTLLARSDIPAEILVRLLGGKLRLTADAARQIADRAGAKIRAIVVDDGEVVGVGRATRIPPGWLTDAIHAVHDTCTGPLCDRPALGADIDHAQPWTPTGDTPGGPTDLDNLGPLCASTNRDREATGWTPVQRPGKGMRTWHHERTGLTTTSVASTWRPPGHHLRIAALRRRARTDDQSTRGPGTDPPPF
jgi:hypothetical protein